MTTPTPPAQDGERERQMLWIQFGVDGRSIRFWTSDVERAAAETAAGRELLIFTAEDKTPWRCPFCEENETQSAELAALRAQVEGLRKLLKLARTAINEEVQAGGLEHPIVAAHARVLRKIDAALAPPQPVAKEK